MSTQTNARNERIVTLVDNGCAVSQIALATGLKPTSIERIVSDARKAVTLPTLADLEAQFGATVTVTEVPKPKKAKATNTLAWYYGAGKDGKRAFRDAIKDALPKDSTAYAGWTFKELTTEALTTDTSLAFLG